ncbi:hypothetical protein ACFSTC_38200 [Nonomuraea ferruginea]
MFGEWNNDQVWSFQLDESGTELVEMNRILGSLSFKKPMDMKFGPDGALYMIEWGSGFGGDNADSGIYRIDYIKGTRPPIARATADKTDGPLPLAVTFSSEGSRDPDDEPLTFAWDLDGDGDTDSTDPQPLLHLRGGRRLQRGPDRHDPRRQDRHRQCRDQRGQHPSHRHGGPPAERRLLRVR